MTQMLTVTANAVLAVPDGYTIDPDTPTLLRAPNGETFKFWVAVELINGRNGDEVYRDLRNDELEERDIHMEPDASILHLAPDPGEGETAQQVYERTGDERLRTVL